MTNVVISIKYIWHMRLRYVLMSDSETQIPSAARRNKLGFQCVVHTFCSAHNRIRTLAKGHHAQVPACSKADCLKEGKANNLCFQISLAVYKV